VFENAIDTIAQAIFFIQLMKMACVFHVFYSVSETESLKLPSKPKASKNWVGIQNKL